MTFMQSTASRTTNTIVVEIDLAHDQLLAVKTMASVSASVSTRSMTATALFSRWSNTPAAIANAANVQPQYRGIKCTKAIATVIANNVG